MIRCPAKKAVVREPIVYGRRSPGDEVAGLLGVAAALLLAMLGVPLYPEAEVR
jgi:hypothetical protein